MPINLDRLMSHVLRLAEVGATPDGGVTRLPFTPELRAAEELVRGWMTDAGLHTRLDAAANIIGRREGVNMALPGVMLGSHIDTVVNGGRYDGALGVLAAIEVAHALIEDGVDLLPALEVVSFTDEEGGFLGSRAMTGTLDPEALAQADARGSTMADAMRAYGLDPAALPGAARVRGEIGAYLELHIEQGAVLEGRGIPLGAVTGIAGTLGLSARISGHADHAGATPMGDARRDALAGAAQMILAAERIARAASPTAVATVGRMSVLPNVSNVIAGEVTISLDVRDIQVETRDLAEAALRNEIERIASLRKLTVSISERLRAAPVPISADMADLVARACEMAGVAPLRLPSGAGHDAQIMAHITQPAMLFVRCRGGVSHSPAEGVDSADIGVAARALYYATRLAAEQIARTAAVA